MRFRALALLLVCGGAPPPVVPRLAVVVVRGATARPLSASVPLAFGTPAVPPSPHFSPFVLPRGGSLARLRLGSRFSVAAPPRANAVAVLLRLGSVTNPLRPRNFGGTRFLGVIGGVLRFSRAAYAMFYNAESDFRGKRTRDSFYLAENLFLTF